MINLLQILEKYFEEHPVEGLMLFDGPGADEFEIFVRFGLTDDLGTQAVIAFYRDGVFKVRKKVSYKLFPTTSDYWEELSPAIPNFFQELTETIEYARNNLH